MTLLGAIFAIAFVLGFARGGRKGLLAVAVCGLPFNSSAMIAAGGNGVSPFYVGLILYTIASLVRPETVRVPRRSGALVALLAVVGFSAVVCPTLFSETRVIAPGVGLDEQVAVQSALDYSLSGLAQFSYLTLALLLVHLNQRDRFITRRLVTIALGIGVGVALAALVAQNVGVTWPTAVFDNFPGNFYAAGSNRLRAQFAEPSQLGAYSLVALAYFTTAAIGAGKQRRTVGHGGMAIAAGLLLVASYSGTAIVGLVVTMAVGSVIGVVVWVKNGTRLPLPIFFMGALGFIVLLFTADNLFRFVIEAVEGKQGGTSFNNRGAANGIAYDIFRDTYGIGVGIGNNRASSLFAMLLSTIGILGVLLFLWLLWRAIIGSLTITESLPMVMALVAQMAAAFTSLADFASPVMWVLIAACYALPLGARSRGLEADRLGRTRSAQPQCSGRVAGKR